MPSSANVDESRAGWCSGVGGRALSGCNTSRCIHGSPFASPGMDSGVLRASPALYRGPWQGSGPDPVHPSRLPISPPLSQVHAKHRDGQHMSTMALQASPRGPVGQLICHSIPGCHEVHTRGLQDAVQHDHCLVTGTYTSLTRQNRNTEGLSHSALLCSPSSLQQQDRSVILHSQKPK